MPSGGQGERQDVKSRGRTAQTYFETAWQKLTAQEGCDAQMAASGGALVGPMLGGFSADVGRELRCPCPASAPSLILCMDGAGREIPGSAASRSGCVLARGGHMLLLLLWQGALPAGGGGGGGRGGSGRGSAPGDRPPRLEMRVPTPGAAARLAVCRRLAARRSPVLVSAAASQPSASAARFAPDSAAAH